MLKFSVCIDALLREYEFCDRIKRAKELGFSAVEFWFWKGKAMELIERAAKENSFPIAAMCADTFREKPSDYRSPLYMEDSDEFCRIADDSVTQAKKMGVSEGRVKVTLLRLREKLKKYLEKEGLHI